MRLKDISVHHSTPDEIELSMTAIFRDTFNDAGRDINFILRPNPQLVKVWQELEMMLRQSIRLAMSPQGVHDVEGFYEDGQ